MLMECEDAKFVSQDTAESRALWIQKRTGASCFSIVLNLVLRACSRHARVSGTTRNDSREFVFNRENAAFTKSQRRPVSARRSQRGSSHTDSIHGLNATSTSPSS